MKKICIVPVLASVITLTACGRALYDNSNISGKAEMKSSITFKADEDNLLEACMDIVEFRFLEEYPDTEHKLMYPGDDSAVFYFNCPDNWDNKTLENICEPGWLTFRKGTDSIINSDGSETPTGEIILTNTDIVSAEAALYSNGTDDAWGVSVEFFDEGKDRFAAVTDELAGSATPLSIWLDNRMISAPTVAKAITDGHAIITGDFSKASAEKLARSLNSGALPCGIYITKHKIGDDSV